jgi:hypothetical protein
MTYTPEQRDRLEKAHKENAKLNARVAEFYEKYTKARLEQMKSAEAYNILVYEINTEVSKP